MTHRELATLLQRFMEQTHGEQMDIGAIDETCGNATSFTVEADCEQLEICVMEDE